MPVEIHITAQMPETLYEEFLQHIRDFEQKDPGNVHLSVWIDTKAMVVKDAVELFKRMKPALPYIQVFGGPDDTQRDEENSRRAGGT